MIDILFDFDGTIIDSSECIFSVYKMLFAELGILCPSDEKLRTFIGPPVEYVIREYLPESEWKQTCDRFRQLYRAVDLKKANALFDGVEEMLARLVNCGKRLFIATTKNETTAKYVAELVGVSKYFTAIYGSRYEINRLTKVDVINTLIKEQNVDKNTVLVGDTHFDAEGARQAGIPTVIVNYGFGNKEELSKYEIEKYLDTPEQVAEYCINRK